MEIGQRIKAKRKADRMSAEDLAVLLRLKKENIYKWERGSKPSDPEEFKRVEDWLNGKVENSRKNVEQAGNDLAPAQEESVLYLSKAIENLTSDKERTTALIERMFSFIERNFNSDGLSKGDQSPGAGGIAKVNPPEPINLDMGGKYRTGSKEKKGT